MYGKDSLIFPWTRWRVRSRSGAAEAAVAAPGLPPVAGYPVPPRPPALRTCCSRRLTTRPSAPLTLLRPPAHGSRDGRDPPFGSVSPGTWAVKAESHGVLNSVSGHGEPCDLGPAAEPLGARGSSPVERGWRGLGGRPDVTGTPLGRPPGLGVTVTAAARPLGTGPSRLSSVLVAHFHSLSEAPVPGRSSASATDDFQTGPSGRDPSQLLDALTGVIATPPPAPHVPLHLTLRSASAFRPDTL